MAPMDGARGTVLCAIEDAWSAVRTTEVATGLATALDARLVIAHVPGGNRSHAVASEGVAASERLLEEVATAVGAEETSDLMVVLGPTVAAILEAAAQESAMLIVMGAEVDGDVLTDMAESAPCPVVVVPGLPPGDDPALG